MSKYHGTTGLPINNHKRNRPHKNEDPEKCVLWFNHKFKYVEGFGMRCKYCGKPITQCRKKTY